jgi:TonB family protein
VRPTLNGKEDNVRSLLQNESPATQRVISSACLSIGVHALLLAAIFAGALHVHHVIITRLQMRGSITSVSVVAFNQGSLAAPVAFKAPAQQDTSPRPKPANHMTVQHAASSAKLTAPPAPKSRSEAAGTKLNPGASGSGSDSQSMYPAYPVFSPSPPVKDHALLPQTEKRIVVDVNLDEQGHVQEARLVNGLGNQLDQIVLDTVRNWQFHPAMLNGTPVPSSTELVFPFNRDYPITD